MRRPGTIIGQDSKIVFSRYGEQLVRVASCRLVKSSNEQYEQSTPEHHSNDDQVTIVVTNSLDIEDIKNAKENPETEPLIFAKETLSQHEPVSSVKAGNEVSFDDDISSDIHVQATTLPQVILIK